MIGRKHKSYAPYFIIALISIFIGLDLGFLYLSKLSYNGVVTKDAYYKGIHYNHTLEQNHQQNALGWEGILDYEYLNTSSELILNFTLYDKEKRLLNNAEVIAYIVRPVTDKNDIEVSLEEAHGRYYKVLKLPQLGQWEIRLHAKIGDQEYFLRRRIMVG